MTRTGFILGYLSLLILPYYSLPQGRTSALNVTSTMNGNTKAQQDILDTLVVSPNPGAPTTTSGEQDQGQKKDQDQVAIDDPSCRWYVYLHGNKLQKESRRCEVLTDLQRYPHGHTFKYERYDIKERVDEMIAEKKIAPMENKYYLSIMAMFKNEAVIMKEWLDHHIAHGVDHFYLIDDYSTDNVLGVLASYIDNGLITMVAPPLPTLPYRQVAAYKRTLTYTILPKNESRWIAVIDLDEFLYSPKEFNVANVLRQHEDLAIVGLNWIWFGSNGLKTQPLSVVQSFTRRADYDYSKYPNLTDHYKILIPHHHDMNDWEKNIINTMHPIHSLEVHIAYVEGTEDNLSLRRYPDDPPLLLNHYSIQSLEFFLKNKGTRGDSNGYYAVSDRNLKWFNVCDINDVVDTRLAEQNRQHHLRLRFR